MGDSSIRLFVSLAFVVLVLMGSSGAWNVGDPGSEAVHSCLVNRMLKAGIPLINAFKYEHRSLLIPLSESRLASTDTGIITYVLRATVPEIASLQDCIHQTSEACKEYSPCDNDGECQLSLDKTSYVCICNPGFSGDACEIRSVGMQLENVGSTVANLSRRIEVLELESATHGSSAVVAHTVAQLEARVDNALSNFVHVDDFNRSQEAAALHLQSELAALKITLLAGVRDKVLNLTNSLAAVSYRLDRVEAEARNSSQYNANSISSVSTRITSEVQTSLDRQTSEFESRLSRLESQAKTKSILYGSCKDIKESDRNATSGYYTILAGGNTKTLVNVYCEMERYGGGWTRIANINPTETNSCPGTLRYQDLQVKVCTRHPTTVGSCEAATYPSIIGEYSEVMGHVTGYSYSTTDAFVGRPVDGALDSNYVDGVTVTTAGPTTNQHIWTYVSTHTDKCPCNIPMVHIPPPPFVGDHYYCSDGGENHPPFVLGYTARAWSNTTVCLPGNCCSNTERPWFHRATGFTASSDPIVLRVCCDQNSNDEDVRIDAASLFVR